MVYFFYVDKLRKIFQKAKATPGVFLEYLKDDKKKGGVE
jgi:hypothetical protein